MPRTSDGVMSGGMIVTVTGSANGSSMRSFRRVRSVLLTAARAW